MSQPVSSDLEQQRSRVARYACLWIGLAPVAPQIIGSVFNIWYNVAVLQPTLSLPQLGRFTLTTIVFNLSVYPLAAALWVGAIRIIQRGYGPQLRGEAVDPETLLEARRRLINLPWWLTGIAGFAWLACIPVFLLALESGPELLSATAYVHLPVSFIIGGSIAITQGVFLVELLGQRLVLPVLFADTSPSEIEGAYPLSLRGHFLMWAAAAGICPIASLVLLNLAQVDAEKALGLTIFVGAVGIAFCLLTAWLSSVLIQTPVRALRAAAQRVSEGDLDVEIHLRRADDFGPLIEDLNDMFVSLREKEHLQETFGRHMGEKAAIRILERNPEADGVSEDITVLFADIRSFTTRASQHPPQDIVALLNRFLTCAVEAVERHDGMVNKYLGDGLMAVFDQSQEARSHADLAVRAALELQRRLDQLNDELRADGIAPLSIGVGIHSGQAVVGSIGSPRRQEYTAIGDTVNCAARIQDLTKCYGSLLVSAATWARMQGTADLQTLKHAACEIRGRDSALDLYEVSLSRPAADR